MRAAVVDSSAFLSLEDPDERNHTATVRAFEGLVADRVPLLTTNFVFDEAYTLILTRLGRDRAIAWGDALLASRVIRLVRVSEDQEEQAWSLLHDFSDKTFSYTDATTFAVTQELAVDGALALDRHFVQYGRLVVLPEQR